MQLYMGLLQYRKLLPGPSIARGGVGGVGGICPGESTSSPSLPPFLCSFFLFWKKVDFLHEMTKPWGLSCYRSTFDMLGVVGSNHRPSGCGSCQLLLRVAAFSVNHFWEGSFIVPNASPIIEPALSTSRIAVGINRILAGDDRIRFISGSLA